jgi:transcription elongation factor GreA
VLEDLKAKLSDEAEALIYELNVTLPNEIEKAVALGDLRENSEYSAALERQRLVHARLDHISRRLSEITSIEMDVIPTDRVGFGSQVTVTDLDDDEVEGYTVAYGDYIDFEKSEISMASPIGKALLGRTVGDEVTIELPAGTLRYRIDELITLHDLAADDGSEEDRDLPADAEA